MRSTTRSSGNGAIKILDQQEMAQISGGSKAQTCATLAGLAVGGALVSAGTTAAVAGLAFVAACTSGDTM